MSSDVLRRAAAKLRDLAAQTSPAPWVIERTNSSEWVMDADRVVYIADCGLDEDVLPEIHADAAWITLASPAIAEPLAA